MRNRVIAVGSVLGALILVGVFTLAFWMVRNPGERLIEETFPVHQVLVVDFHNDGLLHEAELLRGVDAVLMVQDDSRNPDELFNSFSMLQRLDLNHDERLDANDPIFDKLRLVFFINSGKERRYKTFKEAGIKAISIDKNLLTTDPNVVKNPADNLVGYAIMEDGSKRSIRQIVIQ